jgi:riboflavin kinase/FMN adenylyltransferase
MDKKRVIALGFFDGVHLGHIKKKKKARGIADSSHLIPSATTFDEHPQTVIYGKEVPLINSSEDRAWLMHTVCGVDDTLILHFDKYTSQIKWDDFLKLLSSEFGAEYIVAGVDYRCGKDGEGNSKLLKEKCSELNIDCEIIPEVKYDGITISSTIIRELLINGDIKKANTFLGHPHILSDTVRYGFRLGRKLGTPTINMLFRKGVLIPKPGVYITKVYFEGKSDVRPLVPYKGITNVGARPTVDDSGNITAETHILNFRENLYGRKVRIEFHEYLRAEKKFDNLDELKAQIHEDCAFAEKYFRYSHLCPVLF